MSNYSLPAPTVAADIVFHSDVERRLILDVVSGKKAFPASGKNGLLLWGDYGTGKTTLARMLPEEIERGAGGVADPPCHGADADLDGDADLC